MDYVLSGWLQIGVGIILLIVILLLPSKKRGNNNYTNRTASQPPRHSSKTSKSFGSSICAITSKESGNSANYNTSYQNNTNELPHNRSIDTNKSVVNHSLPEEKGVNQ